MTEARHRLGGSLPRCTDVLDAWRLTDALRAADPPLLFGLRLWASVCLALYVAFRLVLDNPFWAGTSAAIVNGIMFILGGVLIARPGVLGSRAIERGLEAATLELAQAAGRPLLIALIVALVLAFLMKETYPKVHTETQGAAGSLATA